MQAVHTPETALSAAGWRSARRRRESFQVLGMSGHPCDRNRPSERARQTGQLSTLARPSWRDSPSEAPPAFNALSHSAAFLEVLPTATGHGSLRPTLGGARYGSPGTPSSNWRAAASASSTARRCEAARCVLDSLTLQPVRHFGCDHGIIPDVGRVGAPATHRPRAVLSGATQNADHELRRSPVVRSVSRECRDWVLWRASAGKRAYVHCPTCV
jgi:hypothetical protein